MAALHAFIFLFLICFCYSDDRLTSLTPLYPGDKLISNDGTFALGFFSLTNDSTPRLYLGIWYNNIPERTYVWIANRDDPIVSPSAELAVTNTSDLVLSDSRRRTVWATENLIAGGVGAAGVLQSSGSFVLQLRNGTHVWQSLDYPTDTILPNFKLWTNYKAHVAVRVVAWKGPQDPSAGDFALSGDPSSWGLQIVIWRGRSRSWRSGVWNGAAASGITRFIYSNIVDDGEEIYATYNAAGGPTTHWKLDYTGSVRFRVWNNQSSSWSVLFERPGNGCLHYGACGPFGYCDITGRVQECKCLDGFEPTDGFAGNFSRGCRRKEALACGGGSHFLTLPGMKVPDMFLYIRNRSFEECAAECDRNCSCTAYAYANLSTILTMSASGTSRCLVWMGELLDAEKAGDIGENLYLRLAGSPVNNNKKKKIAMAIKIVLPTMACLLMFTSSVCLITICKSRSAGRNKETLKAPLTFWDQNLELSCISFEDITAATNCFHETNMLGQGGFGKVYKGTLEDGKEVAVKRLSKGSEQGIEQLRNEVILIASLQHKNLVRLLGCCIHEDEKLLIYEYLPNKSLDKFLFDPAMKSMLDWSKRFEIIKGVARGILYLHQDSRMMIIHRDLKASNILLDAEMNPKISDFGIARIFGSNQQQASTRRVVGTYGYMSPEYAMEGIFSVKSDTYSFGILLLEIVSGLKISSPRHLLMDYPSLTAYAWNLWKDGTARDFVDTWVLESCSLDEALQCIHIGLLCVQDSPTDRPLMSSVVSMLNNVAMPRPVPRQPLFFAQRYYEALEARGDLEDSVNNASLSILEGR
ncbi:hypothetical protein SETIT_4G197400v2 [Setaria italica]|uniref:Receptor-like serine/threonine-protein kinase n=1 Tax=Setaria italica TaxID=4555 RepID=A0A368QW32_SETIT|nr:G-type lectin S-receptor-like serine/threonine-protein kinase B120 [Setaria italica]RCV22151.1 hypothetical protein SETIT_4G197400v2 [Setaria italica]